MMIKNNYRYYRWKWALIGCFGWILVVSLGLLIETYIHDAHYFGGNHHASALEELLDPYRLPSIVVAGVIGSITGFYYGKSKERDLERSAYLREFGKEFLHSASGHLAIIIGFTSLLNDYECPIGSCRKNEDLPKVVKRAKRLHLLIMENLELLKNYDKEQVGKLRIE